MIYFHIFLWLTFYFIAIGHTKYSTCCQGKRLLTDFDATNVVDLCAKNQGTEHVHKRIEDPEAIGAIHLDKNSHNTYLTDVQLKQTAQSSDKHALNTTFY